VACCKKTGGRNPYDPSMPWDEQPFLDSCTGFAMVGTPTCSAAVKPTVGRPAGAAGCCELAEATPEAPNSGCVVPAEAGCTAADVVINEFRPGDLYYIRDAIMRNDKTKVLLV
jgi:hypothetical protein